MKQVVQSLKTGALALCEIPCPRITPGHVLIRTTHSLISAGTERMLLDFGRANLIEKARQQPDKLRLVLDKVRTDGLIPTWNALQNKLDQPLTPGYCNVGVLLDLAADVTGFSIGERVACNGKHAEVVSVPVNLCARVPDGVSDEDAAFTTLGAIALQGIRLLRPTLGEAIVVTGLGLIGQLTVQLLRANGCRVLGIDPDPERLALARTAGADTVASLEDPLAAAYRFSRGRGVDGVLVTAATRSSEPMRQAAQMCRQRGRIVLVGVAGLELSRSDFYKKELSFQVSCSYGPGRYDPSYEEGGHDYPIGFVRWTEQRNFEAFLDLLAAGRVSTAGLVTHRFPLEQAESAYELLGGREPSLGIVLEYETADVVPNVQLRSRRVTVTARPTASNAAVTVAFVGSGNHATSVLIPAFKAAGARLVTVASSAGVTAVHAGRKYGFADATTDVTAILQDPAVDAVVVTTRHDSHADLVLRALEAGKHVFVEKPLCLTLEELAAVESRYQQATGLLLMVGFNRRFAPLIQRLKLLLSPVTGPKSFVMTVNAGAVAPDHWTQDRAVGGGRVLGEACHFVDLLRFLCGSPIVSESQMQMQSPCDDTLTLNLRFADGSIGTVHYFANGSKAFPKERLEVFADGRVLQLDNFRTLKGFGWKGFGRVSLWRQDKGHRGCAAAFLRALRTAGPPPIAFDEIVEVSRTIIALA
jgi:predicted dehydrogenase/threonine dehydrogenase-like Zn-dependent dehydrogenase